MYIFLYLCETVWCFPLVQLKDYPVGKYQVDEEILFFFSSITLVLLLLLSSDETFLREKKINVHNFKGTNDAVPEKKNPHANPSLPPFPTLHS